MSSIDRFAPEHRRRIHLKPGRDKALRNRHPWVFDGGIAREEGDGDAAIADVFAADGSRIASGFYSAKSQIRCRAITFGQPLTPELLRERIATAVRARAHLVGETTDAVRLVHSEGDGLSGLVADLYAGTLVVEITSAGLEKLRDQVLAILRDEAGKLTRVGPLMMKNDLGSRRLEGLPLADEWIGIEGGDIENETTIVENGLRFIVQPGKGQKTGFFIDQRENRATVRAMSRGKRVLNVFSYTGGFGVSAAAGGAASVEEIDSSAPAIAMAARSHELNRSSAALQLVVADAFEHLRKRRAEGAVYDLVVVDPPAFAKSRGDVDRAARGYKDINMQAFFLVAPGGTLVTFSCSGHVSSDLFQKIVFSAAADARRDASILRRLGAGEDHPVSIYCPEGEYLKGLVLRVGERN
ncbi:MAG: class I SAM-dependent rRNA methyltransferase [Thermoanaerobaculia bacterium]